MQRREHARYRLWFPVQLSGASEAKIATSHNIGAGGMLVAVCAQLEVGQPVTLHFRLPPSEVERTLTGHIVRIDPNEEDPDGEWPFKVGVAFEQIESDLIPHLEAAVARFGA